MSSPLLVTKLFAPRSRPEWVPRSRLVERLQAGLSRKFTLLSAPAGFGKTTLLSEWIAATDRPVAWVSLDSGDNDPARLLTYFIAAIREIYEQVGEASLAALKSAKAPSPEIILTTLINEIAKQEHPFVVILDDYHVIENRTVHEAARCLIDNLPPQMHLVLATRSDPPWPLAGLRASGELNELRARHLRFNFGEAERFLNASMRLGLSPENVASLEERTEGWIAGLQMAALSMRAKKEIRPEVDLSEFVQAFGASNRFILDYLLEEVLDQQPLEVQEFMLKTSILERMQADLCDAVTGEQNGQEILVQLDRDNLFLVPLDEERRWYRYHHLFAGLLQVRLDESHAGLAPRLHQKASQWYENEGLIPEAVHHAVVAGDAERVANLVAKRSLPMIYEGELGTLLRWLESLPPEEACCRPWLCISHAWVLTYTGKLDAVEPHLQDAERQLKELDESAAEGPADSLQPLTQAEREDLAGHIAAIRAYILALRGDLARAARLAGEALKGLTEEDLVTRGFAETLHASCLRWIGELEASSQAYTKAIAICRRSGQVSVAVDVLCDLATLQVVQGQLHRSAATCREALRVAEERARPGGGLPPNTGYACIRMSALLREWNQLDEACRQALEGLERCIQWGQTDILVRSYLEAARTFQACGEFEQAMDAVQEARLAAPDLSAWYVDRAASWEARLLLAQGDLEGSYRWAAQNLPAPQDELRFEYAEVYLNLARVLHAWGSRENGGALAEARQLLARLMQMAEDAGAVGYLIEILTLQALVKQAQGESDQAMGALERALHLAEPEGYVRLFLDEAPAIMGLLRRAAASGIELEYVGQLLDHLESRPRLEPATSPLVEPLSDREQEVLRMLTTSLSTPEIAEELVIGVNTVRSHVKSIYGKLGVHRRLEAVARARELGLL